MNNQQVTNQFEQILQAAKERRGDLAVDSMIVSSHLAQMRTFMLRRGIEFYSEQDTYGARKDFVAGVYESNMMDMKLDSIIDYFLCDGQGLFYFRPQEESYQLLFFPKDSYRAYRGQNGDLESVVLIYSFNVSQGNAVDMMPSHDKRGGKKKFIRLKVYKDRIEQTVSSEKIEFENEMGTPMMVQPGATETLNNSLGFIPAVEVFNFMDCTGEATGNGEFNWLAHQILYHDELVRNIRKNLKFFGNPTLVSSRPKHDLIESGEENTFRPTISSQAGFAALGQSSSRVSQPFGGASPIDGQIKVPRVIANLEPTDRVSYMTPDSVSGDQNMYVKQYRSEIRLALGGVDDIDINTAQTAYEIKTLYGRVAATAEKKARGLFTYGLCKIFAMMIKHEEYLFNESIGPALGLMKPQPPLKEDFQGSEEEWSTANENHKVLKARYDYDLKQAISVTLETGEIPPGTIGLIPDGSRKIDWRWTGEVFEDNTEDILNNSIVVRNLQEVGVGSIEALKYLFPGKTEEERAAMLSGYPFRMVKETQQSLSTFIGLLGQLYQLPHPQTPDIPLAADPNLDITGFLYRSLDFLRKELSYSGRYKPSNDTTGPSTLSAADRIRAARGIAPVDEPKPNLPGLSGPTSGNSDSGIPGIGPGPAGFGGESMANGVSGTKRRPEFSSSLPIPGTTIGLPNSGPAGVYTGSVGFGAGSTGSQPGDADLQSPSFNPNLFGQPNISSAGANARASARGGKRRVPQSGK